MKRSLYLAATISISLHPWLLLGESHFIAPNVTIGNHLETPVRVSLDDFVPDDGMEITVKSSDPARLLISARSDKPGGASIVLRARAGNRTTPEFWLQGADDSGTVQYTVEGTGFAKAAGTVNLTPSGIVMVGPLKASKYMTTTGARPSRVQIHTVRLDTALKYAEEQASAVSLALDIVGSNPSAGHPEDPHLIIPAGQNLGNTQFQPAGEGDTTLSIKPLSAVKFKLVSELIVSVKKPGFGVPDGLRVGQNLQLMGIITAAEPAGEKGIKVTLASDDPSLLLLSNAADKVGSKTAEIFIEPGHAAAPFYMQALAGSGEAGYTASAPGFRKNSASVVLTPSGVIIMPAWQGPPDEAQLFRAHTVADRKSKLSVNLANKDPGLLVVWTAQLDPNTHRCADITVQALRPGYSIKVPLVNSNPAIGDPGTEIELEGGSSHNVVKFAAKSEGTTELSVGTPKDFTPAANSTTTIITVK